MYGKLILATMLVGMAAAQPVQLTYLGTAGWQITDGKTVILIDPFLTRYKANSPNDAVDPDDPRPVVTAATVLEPDAAVIDAHIARADYIFLTHSHPDHTLDMPYIARKTGAMVLGTESTANIARARGVPAAQIRVVKPGDDLKFDSFSVRVIHSLHGIFRKPVPGLPAPVPPLIPADIQAPLRLGQYQEGGTLAYLFTIGGHQIIDFGSMNFDEAAITGLRPDVALIGAMPERTNIDAYTPRIMKALGYPAIVIPTHWDRFNVGYGVSQQPAIDRLKSFLDDMKAASPKTRVIVPEYFKPITLEPAR